MRVCSISDACTSRAAERCVSLNPALHHAECASCAWIGTACAPGMAVCRFEAGALLSSFHAVAPLQCMAACPLSVHAQCNLQSAAPASSRHLAMRSVQAAHGCAQPAHSTWPAAFPRLAQRSAAFMHWHNPNTATAVSVCSSPSCACTAIAAERCTSLNSAAAYAECAGCTLGCTACALCTARC